MVAGVFVYFVPETFGAQLPETIEDIEQDAERKDIALESFQKFS